MSCAYCVVVCGEGKLWGKMLNVLEKGIQAEGQSMHAFLIEVSKKSNGSSILIGLYCEIVPPPVFLYFKPCIV